MKPVRNEALSCQEIGWYRKGNTLLHPTIKDLVFLEFPNFSLRYKGQERKEVIKGEKTAKNEIGWKFQT